MRSSGSLTAGIVAVLSWLLYLHTTDAQTVITYTDLKTAYTVGQTSVGSLTPPNQIVTVKIGKPSMNAQDWDFSSLSFEQSSNIEVVDPGEAPYSTLFGTANVVRRSSLRAISEAFYEYSQLASGAYSLLGYYVEGDTSAYLYSPAVRMLKLPCGFGSSWNHTSDPVHPAPGVTVITRYFFVVDAQGTMKIRQGSFPAIRLRCETETDIQSAAGNSLVRQYRFSYITPEMIIVSLSIDSTQTALTEVQVTNVGIEVPSSPVGVERLASPQRGERMFNVFPSPVRSGEEAMIRCRAQGAGPIQITVYDILGREVSRLPWREAVAGENLFFIPTRGLLPGVYFCAMSAGGALSTGVVTVTR